LLLLIGGSLAVAVVGALMATSAWGEAVIWPCAVAMAICLIPATITLVVSERALSWRPEHQVAVIMGGTGLRMFVVAILTFVLSRQVVWLNEESGFMMWVLAFYGLTLGLEVTAILWAMAVKKPTAAATSVVTQGTNASVSVAE
jgi:hypothetical protein